MAAQDSIGSAVSQLAIERNFNLYILSRGIKEAEFLKEVKHIKGDIRDIDSIKEKLRGFEFDVVVNWIAYTPEEIKNDIDIFGGSLKQYIFISSASVYQKPSTNYLINELTPLSNPFWMYAQNKIECEKLLLYEYAKNCFPVTIVRPSYTYYKNIPFIFNSKTRPWTLIDRLYKGYKIIVPGDGTSLFTLTHGLDFAYGLLGIIGNLKAIGQSFHITSDEALTWDQIINKIAKAVEAKPNIIHIPSDFICSYSPTYYGSLIGDKSVSTVFDNSKIKSYVPGFQAKILFSEGINRAIEWYKLNPSLCEIDNDFNNLVNYIIESYEKGFINLRNHK